MTAARLEELPLFRASLGLPEPPSADIIPFPRRPRGISALVRELWLIGVASQTDAEMEARYRPLHLRERAAFLALGMSIHEAERRTVALMEEAARQGSALTAQAEGWSA